MPDFELHTKLAEDSFAVGDTSLSTVRLMNDSRFPWVLLVPKQPGLRDIHDLSPLDQIQLMAEISHLSKSMQADWAADKTNVAALGNMVPQLHIHIIMRYEGDEAWPGPVWGVGEAEPYDDAEAAALVEQISGYLRGV